MTRMRSLSGSLGAGYEVFVRIVHIISRIGRQVIPNEMTKKMKLWSKVVSNQFKADGSVGQTIEGRSIDAIRSSKFANCKGPQISTMLQHENFHGGQATNEASHPPRMHGNSSNKSSPIVQPDQAPKHTKKNKDQNGKFGSCKAQHVLFRFIAVQLLQHCRTPQDQIAASRCRENLL